MDLNRRTFEKRSLVGWLLLLAVLFGACGRSGAGSDAAGAPDTAQQEGILADGAEQVGVAADDRADGSNTAAGAGAQSGTEQAGGVEALAAEAIPEEERTRKFNLTLGFAGDICFADNYIPAQRLAELGSEDISDGIDPAFIELMRGMDLMWINNEFVYSDRGAPLPGKAWTFCSSPAHVGWLHDLGVDIVGLANNHSYDFGKESFLDTLDTLEKAEIPYVGAGRDFSRAASPIYLETSGFTIAYVAASCCEYTIYTPEATDTEPGILWCYDREKFLDSIREAREHADFVIALPHWGIEHSTELDDNQLYGAPEYIDAGADIVIGAHPHILQGIDYYKGKPILYSLGNFWFDGYDIDTMVAEIRISGEAAPDEAPSLADADIEIKLYPGTQSGVYTALADTEEWRDRIFRHLESISGDITIDEEGVVTEAA